MAVVVFVAVAASLASAGAADSENPPADPLVISHRGASAEAPEHTFAAYDRAVEEHTDVLECDLQLTADGVLVCMHDTTVDRTTGGGSTGRVDSFTLEQLRAMDFGSWFDPKFAGAAIVPFEEQLRCYRKAAPGVQFYAETKAPSEYGGRMEPALVDLLRKLELVPDGSADVHTAPVIIQSFDLQSLIAVKQLAPSLPTALLWVAPPADQKATAPGVIDVMAPVKEYLLANPTAIEQIHAGGRDVHTWTVDEPAKIDQLLAAGVDGIFSNDTATLRARVDAKTGHGARRRARLEAGCPGVAGTVTAASTQATSTTTLAPAGDQAQGLHDEDDTGSSSSWIAPAVIIGVLLAALGFWFVRKRPS
jgi:glycerophosphoryl diester phosphodiesterase